MTSEDFQRPFISAEFRELVTPVRAKMTTHSLAPFIATYVIKHVTPVDDNSDSLVLSPSFTPRRPHPSPRHPPHPCRYVFLHNRVCDHLFVVSDIRMEPVPTSIPPVSRAAALAAVLSAPAAAPPTQEEYPRLSFRAKPNSRRCGVCHTKTAVKTSVGHPLSDKVRFVYGWDWGGGGEGRCVFVQQYLPLNIYV